MLSSFIFNGSDNPPTRPMILRAGPLSLLFEPQSAVVRRVSWNEHELWRGLYVAVRDCNWGTIAPRVNSLQAQIEADLFRLDFDVECSRDEINFLWHGTLAGSSNGIITFSFDGEARSTFLRNRIGFCLLHPMHCAGARCELEHVDDSKGMLHFPRAIAPHQPFTNLRAMTHEAAPGVWCTANLEGDIFETEDQRNWTDASFKTYCTPLSLPFPVEVSKGTQIRQKVSLFLDSGDPWSLAIREKPKNEEAPPSSFITIDFHEDLPWRLPFIGFGVASHGKTLSEKEIARLKLICPAHLRVDLDLTSEEWLAHLEQAVCETDALNTQLEIALHLSLDDASLHTFARIIEEQPVSIARLLVFGRGEIATSENSVQRVRDLLQRVKVPIFGGTNAYFTELNRNRPPVEILDGVCFSINPQVHTFDDISLMENLAAQAAVVESARRFFGDLPIAVSPVTLKPRFNPVATGPAPPIASDKLPPQVDARQMSLFGAAWTLGSLKYLIQSQANSVTFYETTGWRGVMQNESIIQHSKFPAPPGCVFPLYHVLADVAEFYGGNTLSSHSSAPLQVEVLAFKKGQLLRTMLANMTSEPQTCNSLNLRAL